MKIYDHFTKYLNNDQIHSKFLNNFTLGLRKIQFLKDKFSQKKVHPF